MSETKLAVVILPQHPHCCVSAFAGVKPEVTDCGEQKIQRKLCCQAAGLQRSVLPRLRSRCVPASARLLPSGAGRFLIV